MREQIDVKPCLPLNNQQAFALCLLPKASALLSSQREPGAVVAQGTHFVPSTQPQLQGTTQLVTAVGTVRHPDSSVSCGSVQA